MEKVMQTTSDVERKMTKINHSMHKSVSRMSINDMVKQARIGNSVKHTIRKGIKKSYDANATESEARELLAQMTRLVDLEVNQMDLTIQSKPQFDRLYASGFVRRHIEKSDGQGSPLDIAKVIIERSAPDLLPELHALQWTEYNKFHEMQAYYSEAVGGEEKVNDDRE